MISLNSPINEDEFLLINKSKTDGCDRFHSIKQERLHDLVFNNTSDLMMCLDKSGKIININKAGLKFSGFKEGEVIGKTFWTLPGVFQKKFITTYIRVYKNALKNKSTIGFISELHNRSDKKYVMEFSTYPIIVNKKEKYILVIGKNLTERIIKEKALKKTEKDSKEFQDLAKHYSVLAENTLGIIFQTTKTGKITYINSAVENIAGWKTSEMIGKKFTKFVPKKELPKYFPILKNALSGKEIGSFESFVLHKDGHLIPVEFDGKLVHGNRKIIIQGTIKDITKRKKAEDELKEARDQLELRVKERTSELLKTNKKLQQEINEREKTEKKLKSAHKKLNTLNQDLEKKVKERTAEVHKLLEQKDEFINQLGHDLKNPLNPLTNLLPLLENYAVDSKSKEILRMLNRNSDFMKNLVVKTIQLARLNSPSTQLNYERIDLFNEVNTIIENNNHLIEQGNCEIEINISDKLILNADKLRITELFDNLISNAVKYSPNGSKIKISANKKRDEVIISVNDSGVGLEKDQLERIFDEFYKVDKSRHDFKSSGLGLPICKRIVEKHGGRIWAESKGPNQGTTISLILPAPRNN